jgi:hypothetical protein
MLFFQSEPLWAPGYFDFPAPGNPQRRLLLFYERPGQVRVAIVPSLAEIDAAEKAQAGAVPVPASAK